MRQRDVVEHDVEPGSSSREIISDQSCDIFSLRNQLTGVELGDNTFEDFVDDRGQDSLVVIGPESSVDLR